MSLIVKGMSLPENDGMKELVIGRAPNGTEPIAIVSGDITEFYKIIEIPASHGRLIDADKLLKSIDIMREQRCKTCSSRIDTKHCDRNGCWMIFISDFIGSLPTIIEAEVSE